MRFCHQQQFSFSFCVMFWFVWKRFYNEMQLRWMIHQNSVPGFGCTYLVGRPGAWPPTIWSISEAIECGKVGVNLLVESKNRGEHLDHFPICPFEKANLEDLRLPEIKSDSEKQESATRKPWNWVRKVLILASLYAFFFYYPVSVILLILFFVSAVTIYFLLPDGGITPFEAVHATARHDG